MLIENEDGQVMLFDPDLDAGKMCPVLSVRPPGMTSKRSSRSSSTLKNHSFMLLDLRPGAGNMLGPCWEYDPVWLGPPGTLNTSECPKDVVASSLSQILVDSAPSRYYLSQTACLGILRRAEERGKELPWQLEQALRIQAGLDTPTGSLPETPSAFAINQRREARDLRDKSVALTSSSGTEMQTFIAQAPAGFLPEASSTARDIGYQEECAPTLKAGGKSSAVMLPAAGFAEYSNQLGLIGYQEECASTLKAGGIRPQVMLPTLCLNDQGGKVMECSEDISGTLRAQEHGHQPLVFENHGIDARYTGPYDVAPTMAARYGTGGNNTPLVASDTSYCIVGNTIDRKPQNGGNGTGYSEDLSFTLTATDHHAVLPPYQETIGALCRGDEKGVGNQYVSQDKCIVERHNLIRRLLPIECERLQGFPDDWTNIPGASDSARYKALGNSVAIPCVELLIMGISLVIRNGKDNYSTVEALCRILRARRCFHLQALFLISGQRRTEYAPLCDRT